MICHCLSSLCKWNTHWFLLQETSHCRDSNIQIRVCCCKNMCWANHWPPQHSVLLRSPSGNKSYMFGDSESVVNSSMNVHAKLHKCHTALSFHRVCEVIASKFVDFVFLPGSENPADILSKHWSYNSVKDILLPLLNHHGWLLDPSHTPIFTHISIHIPHRPYWTPSDHFKQWGVLTFPQVIFLS